VSQDHEPAVGAAAGGAVAGSGHRVDHRPGSSMRRALFMGVGGTALLAGATAAWWNFLRPGHTPVPESLFKRSFDDLHGRPQPMAQWQGRWLLLNFWATWCPPCVEEMPLLQATAREFAARNLSVVGIGIDRVDAMRRFQAEFGLDIPLLVAGAGGSDLARELGNSSGALPYTVLISPDGRLVETQLGRLRPETLSRWLDRRLRI